MPTLRNKTRFLVICCSLAGFAYSDSMDNFYSQFTGSVNVTGPQLIQNQAGSTYSVGSVNLRTQTTDTQLLYFNPPSVSMGCGGMDLFMGSIGHVSAAQFQQLLTGIGQALPPIAIYAAIDAMSPGLGNNLRNIMQQLSDLLNRDFNSCKIASSLVNAGTKSLGWGSNACQTSFGQTGTQNSGSGTDQCQVNSNSGSSFMNSFSQSLSSANTALDKITDPNTFAVAENLKFQTGQVVYKAFQIANTLNPTAFGDGGHQFANYVISMIGDDYIYPTGFTDKGGNQNVNNYKQAAIDPLINNPIDIFFKSAADIDGSNRKFYNCSGWDPRNGAECIAGTNPNAINNSTEQSITATLTNIKNTTTTVNKTLKDSVDQTVNQVISGLENKTYDPNNLPANDPFLVLLTQSPVPIYELLIKGYEAGIDPHAIKEQMEEITLFFFAQAFLNTAKKDLIMIRERLDRNNQSMVYDIFSDKINKLNQDIQMLNNSPQAQKANQAEISKTLQFLAQLRQEAAQRAGSVAAKSAAF